jgi:hypothetical protein
VLPLLTLIGWILGGMCSLIHGIVLFRLASEEAGYRTAGIYSLVAAMLNAVYLCFGLRKFIIWVFVFAFVTMLATTLSVCCEIMSHGTILAGWDDDLARRWGALRNRYLVAYAMILVALMTILIAPVWGGGLMAVGSAVLCRVDAYKSHYLLLTLRVFRRYPIE